MRTIVIAIAAAALAPGATPTLAQNLTAEEEGDRFQLFTKCRPVFPTVAIERSSPYIEDLADSDLEEVIYSGLRSAGLLSEDEDTPFLYVAIGILHWAYVVRIELLKLVNDPRTDIHGAATTWRTYRYGIHSGDPAFVISSLNTALQTFLDEYLRVNEGSCSSRADPGGDSAVSVPGAQEIRLLRSGAPGYARP